MYDLVISGGTIVTADAKHRVIDDGVVAVAGDTIAAILTKEQAAQQNLTAREHINADNMIVMPALINSHCHLAECLFRGSGASVSLEARRSAGRIPLSASIALQSFMCHCHGLWADIFFKKLYIFLILAYNSCSSVIFHLIKGKDEEVCHE